MVSWGLPEVTYLSVDPVSSTVGSSQVLAYVKRLAERGVPLHLYSFEHEVTDPTEDDLRSAGVRWTPLEYGAPGARGGLDRVRRLRRAIRGAQLVHARSDMAAVAAMSAGVGAWLWDVRSLWADQKVATGVFGDRSLQARLFRRVEALAAQRSDQVVTLTESAIGVLDDRYDGLVGPKATVVTTCVDRRRFAPRPPQPDGPLRVLLAGTLNQYYDVAAMVRLVEDLRDRRPVDLMVVSPESTPWEAEFTRLGADRRSATPLEMVDLVAWSHLGLSVCRDDAGPSLLAAMPTKIGEFLSVGRPVVVNGGLVDAARMLEESGAGVALGAGGRSRSDDVDRVLSVVDSPATASAAVELAVRRFDLDAGVDRLVDVYRAMAADLAG